LMHYLIENYFLKSVSKGEVSPYFAFINEFLASLVSSLLASSNYKLSLPVLPSKTDISNANKLEELKVGLMGIIGETYGNSLACFFKELGEEEKGWELVKEVTKEIENASKDGENILNKIITTAEKYQKGFYSSSKGREYIERESKNIEELVKKRKYSEVVLRLKHYSEHKETYPLVEEWKNKVFPAYMLVILKEVDSALKANRYESALTYLERIEEDAKKLRIKIPSEVLELESRLREII